MWLQAAIKPRLRLRVSALPLPRIPPSHPPLRTLASLARNVSPTQPAARDPGAHDRLADPLYTQPYPLTPLHETPPADTMVYQHGTPYVTPHILHKSYAQAFDNDSSSNRELLFCLVLSSPLHHVCSGVT